jgi:hypothetical protein
MKEPIKRASINGGLEMGRWRLLGQQRVLVARPDGRGKVGQNDARILQVKT